MSVYAPSTSERDVPCVHCGRPIRLSPAARSTTCPHCYRGMSFDDVVIAGEWSGKLATGGRVSVRPGARVAARLIEAAQSVDVAGTVEGRLLTRATLRVHPDGAVRGEVHARAIEVPRGATLDADLRIAP